MKIPDAQKLAREPYWSAADGAELDVLTYELATGFAKHREHCAACDGSPCEIYESFIEHRETCGKCRLEPWALADGVMCPRRLEWVAHGDSCVRCNPCPHVGRAIQVVIDWRTSRVLLSRAEYLRSEIASAEPVEHEPALGAVA